MLHTTEGGRVAALNRIRLSHKTAAVPGRGPSGLPRASGG